jgi:hypothetical protein
MIAVYAYTQKDHHYKPLNESFIRLARLSVKSAKKYYKTRFYCDEPSLQFFNENGIFFDEVIMVGDFVKDYPTISSISKIYAMMHQTEPYLLLDLDTVLLEKITSQHTITYGHPEIQINHKYISLDTLLYTYERYLNPFNSHIRRYFDDLDISKMDWLMYPSFCLVMVQSPLLIRDVYLDIFNRIPKQAIAKIPAELVEQFLCHQKLVVHKVDFAFFSNEHYIMDDMRPFNTIDTLSKKYLHLNINNKKIEEVLIYLETII